MNFTVAMTSHSVQVPKLSIGDVVTFSAENYSKKHVPINPVILRIRSDLSWHNVVNTKLQLPVSDIQK
jgi:hypothetical protein